MVPSPILDPKTVKSAGLLDGYGPPKYVSSSKEDGLLQLCHSDIIIIIIIIIIIVSIIVIIIIIVYTLHILHYKCIITNIKKLTIYNTVLTEFNFTLQTCSMPYSLQNWGQSLN